MLLNAWIGLKKQAFEKHAFTLLAIDRTPSP
jgi:hypothetical protein